MKMRYVGNGLHWLLVTYLLLGYVIFLYWGFLVVILIFWACHFFVSYCLVGSTEAFSVSDWFSCFNFSFFSVKYSI